MNYNYASISYFLMKSASNLASLVVEVNGKKHLDFLFKKNLNVYKLWPVQCFRIVVCWFEQKFICDFEGLQILCKTE